MGETTSGTGAPVSNTCSPSEGVEALAQARAIVLASHQLHEAKLAGGYSPLSCDLDDSIVADAIKTLLDAIAKKTTAEMGGEEDLSFVAADEAVSMLLGQGDDDINGKFVDCLTIGLQRELCAALVSGEFGFGGVS